MLPIPRLSGVRPRLEALALVPAVLVAAPAAVSFQPDAVATKFVNKLGIGGLSFKLDNILNVVLKPAGGAGLPEIKDLVIAIVALIFLGAIVYFAFGILSTMGGRRGGVEKVGAVIFSLVFGIAALSIIG